MSRYRYFLQHLRRDMSPYPLESLELELSKWLWSLPQDTDCEWRVIAVTHVGDGRILVTAEERTTIR